MHSVVRQAFHAELEKIALLERLVRLAATDIPGTPRIVMRHRSPADLRGLQEATEDWWARKVTSPIMRKGLKAGKKIQEKLPKKLMRSKAGKKIRETARKGLEVAAKDPIGHGLIAPLIPTPVPGLGHVLIEKGKKGLEAGIDRLAPLSQNKAQSYSGPLRPS